MSITITINADTAKEAVWELQMLTNALTRVVPTTPNDDLDVPVSLVSGVDSTDTDRHTEDASSVDEATPAPVKRGRGRPRKSETVPASDAPAPTDEAQPTEEVPPPAPPNPEDEVKAVVARLTEIFQNGDPATREKIVTWRDSVGLNYLKHMTPEHLPAATALLEVLQ